MVNGNCAVGRGPFFQSGFTYILVLLSLALTALASQGVLTYASQQALHDREDQLLQVGQSYVQAIKSYYDATPGTRKALPMRLQDLLEDTRQVGLQRHLREIYPDPLARSAEWGVLRTQDGGIMGVFSLSDQPPIRSGWVYLDGLELPPARKYSDWKFVFDPVANARLRQASNQMPLTK